MKLYMFSSLQTVTYQRIYKKVYVKLNAAGFKILFDSFGQFVLNQCIIYFRVFKRSICFHYPLFEPAACQVSCSADCQS